MAMAESTDSAGGFLGRPQWMRGTQRPVRPKPVVRAPGKAKRPSRSQGRARRGR